MLMPPPLPAILRRFILAFFFTAASSRHQ